MGGFHHGSRDNNDSVLLAGGGYKSVSDFLLSQDHYKTSPGAGTAGTSSATSGSTLAVPYVTVNANGHVTGYGTHTHTVTGFLTSHLSVTNSNPNIKYGNTMTIGSVGGTNLQITLPNNEGTSNFTDSTELLTSYASNNGFADTNAPGVIYRRKAVSMYNYLVSKGFLTAQDHYKTSPGAGTAGTSSATSGSALAVPYITVNANGHVTGYGTHTHTVNVLAKLGSYTSSAPMSATGHTSDDEGLSWRTLYSASGPTTYGNVITIGNTGKGLLCLGWDGGQTKTDGTDTHVGSLYYRSKRDNQGGWTIWRQIAYTSDLVNSQYYTTLNGTNKGHTSGTSLGSFYAPTSSGTSGLILKSNGSNSAPTWVDAGTTSVAWVDVTDKIHGGNEFNMVNSGYSSTLWFNYCPVNDRSGSASVSEYIFGNGNKGKADICANTVYPSVTNTYYLGKSSYVYAGAYTRFIQSDSALSFKTNGNNTRMYINTSGYVGIGTTSPVRSLNVIGEVVIGESNYTAPQSTGSGYSGTWIGQGWMELSTTDPYIDFHKSKSTADFTSRLIHWNDKVRLKYENSDSTYSGYVLTCEGNHHNPVILGIFDLRRYKPSSTMWSLDNICGPCYFTLSNSWGSDVSYHDSNSYWTIPSNLLRVEINSTLGAYYTTKTTVKAAACIGTVMTRWINNQPVVANRLHGDWQGCSVECLCTNKAPGDSLYYDSQLPGKYIYITGARPWGYDDGSNGLGMDQFRQTGNLSYQRVRFVVYGWLE